MPFDVNGTELLAPARDLECGIAAIDCGADAVYIGAPRFGAREAAGNSLDDIAALAAHAHRFWARVYVTLNTLLRDDELDAACRTAWQLHEAGIDGLIIQDMGLLESALPPLPLIASTQCHNHTPERVAFLERCGFRRAILARELELEQIRAIRRAAPRIELECFVHGALCVSYSGQCWLSYALGGRSGNRGQCAQPCRKPYTLVDAEGQALASGHLLSLRDLNLSGHLPELLAAGVSSFKIEGRLKDRAYVTNVVAHYRQRLDALGVPRSSSGATRLDFAPDVTKTFNRGFTTYFLNGRGEAVGSPETPKMTGERLGAVKSTGPDGFAIDAELRPGDGFCFFDRDGRLRGSVVNAVRDGTVVPDKMDGIEPGTVIHRNHDHEFLTQLRRSRPERRIAVRFRVSGSTLAAIDEDGNRVEMAFDAPPAAKPERALETLRRQLEKTGETEFACAGVEIEGGAPFLPVSALNALRREALERLRAGRERNRPKPERAMVPNDAPYPERELPWTANVLNRRAEEFYRRHGVASVEPAAESGLDMRGRRVMTTRHCVREQLGMCGAQAPLMLVDDEGRRLELRFACAGVGTTFTLCRRAEPGRSLCRMEVWTVAASQQGSRQAGSEFRRNRPG